MNNVFMNTQRAWKSLPCKGVMWKAEQSSEGGSAFLWITASRVVIHNNNDNDDNDNNNNLQLFI